MTYQPVRSEAGKVDAMVFTSHDVDDLVQDVLVPDMVWMLRTFKEYGSIVRRHLAELAAAERPHLTEGVIRGMLLTTETLKLTKAGTGRNGSSMTEKGRIVADKWDSR